jgi:hypothetical protein
MTPTAALIVAAILVTPGTLLILAALWPVGSLWRSAALILGGTLVLSGTGVYSVASHVSPAPQPTPTPGPLPGPYVPVPAPVGDFTNRVRASFTGTKAEAQVVGALHSQFASSLAFDGTRTKPIVTNANQMAKAFAELQRYRSGSEAPWGERFVALSNTIAGEAAARGILAAGKFDAARRAAAAQFYAEVGAILGATP